MTQRDYLQKLAERLEAIAQSDLQSANLNLTRASCVLEDGNLERYGELLQNSVLHSERAGGVRMAKALVLEDLGRCDGFRHEAANA